MAPEIYSGSAYSNKVDIYSLGALIFVMLTGRPPFLGSTQYGVQMKKIQNAISLPPGSKVDKCAVEELGLFLQTFPSETQALWNGTAALVGRLSSDNNSIQI